MIKNINSKILTFAITLIISFTSYAQDRSCGMVEHMNEQMRNPEFAREYEETQIKFRKALDQRLRNKSSVSSRLNPIIVPVAVHFPEGQESNRAC